MPDIVAIDVDINRFHAYSSRSGRLFYNEPSPNWDEVATHQVILIEVASGVSTAASSAEEYNRRKWAVANSFQIGWATRGLAERGLLDRILVSPANLWTLGYAEETRDQMASVAGTMNHDLRACAAMILFYQTNPGKWKPLLDYFQSLSSAKPKAKKTKSKP
jgi:hypothetical protein